MVRHCACWPYQAVRQSILTVLLITFCVSGIVLHQLYTTFYVFDVRTLPRRHFPALRPHFRCNDVMRNLTNGRWMHWKYFVSDSESEEFKKLEKEEKLFDEHMTEFRIKRGIHTRLWRDDLKCGLENKQTKPEGNAWGGSVGAWCDSKSDQPCCSDENNGDCGMTCDCKNCVDMRKIIHAEFAKWVPSDARCVWKNYTAKEACKVVRKFSEIHVVGDSFIRKMGRVMMLMLRGDRNYGVMSKTYEEYRKKLCVADDQLYWTECLLESGTYKDLLVDESPLCGMDLSKFVLHSHYAYDAGEKALELAKSLAGKPGSVILLGVGGHLNCRAARTFKTNVQPIFEFLNSYDYSLDTYAMYGAKGNEKRPKDSMRWPLVIFTFPDTPDVLKSPDYRAANGKAPCDKFSAQMIEYLSHVGIPYLDFRNVTSAVHSYDGTHHGIGVNIVKLQILFNYLESLEWFNGT